MISARDAFVDTSAFSRERAKPLSPDERRSAIVDATIPLIRELGRSVSTRQIAEAAGVAEGTLFRAFGDKDSIIQAAIDRFLDPEPFREALRRIDPDDETEAKVGQLLGLLRIRFEGVIGFTSAIGMHGPPPERPRDEEWIGIVERMFRADELSVPTSTLAFYLRLLAFGSAIPIFNSPHPFDIDELTALAVRGVLPVPAPAAPDRWKEH